MSKLFISGVFLSLLFIGCTSTDVRNQESQIQSAEINSQSSAQEPEQAMQEEQVIMLKVIGMT